MLLRRAIAVALLLAATPAAAETACPEHFADGRVPALTNPKLAARTLPLCFEAFALLHSGASRTPLYAAERLTRESVTAARAVARDDSFHEEDRLPAVDRSELEDYVHSGFDRGHLAPAGDMPTPTAQGQSFSLANIVPQNRAFNRGLWAGIEESVRRLASERGTLYVVTGVVFTGGSVDALKSRVLVPTQLYKALYDPARGEAGAYLAPNRAGAAWQAVSIAGLNGTAGVDVFPGLPDAVKRQAMPLPEPREFARGDEAERRSPREETWQDWLWREAGRALRKAIRDTLRAIF
ncbi:DNA/RNA non-specific endonuclease [Methylobacterium radiodurans]|uniref:DNA/RNA non-specific endonuclease n=1 Tax=Methylobacterium radiodurans TaxID=2202828 RepID=UPI001FE86D01|nr:DNA/RNA non-specific endonuclease [Methylobacterium radiodurans]